MNDEAPVLIAMHLMGAECETETRFCLQSTAADLEAAKCCEL